MKQALADHALHRAQIAELFRSRPLEEITAEELRRITPHYQQRISQCRQPRFGGMEIRNVEKSWVDEQGVRHRLDGSYVFVPKPAIGIQHPSAYVEQSLF